MSLPAAPTQCKAAFNRSLYDAACDVLGPDVARLLYRMAFDGRRDVKQDGDGPFVTGWRAAKHFAEVLQVSVYTVRRWWRKLRDAGFLEQWRITRGLAYRVRLPGAAGRRAVPEQALLFAPAAPPGAPSALAARSPDKHTQPKQADVEHKPATRPQPGDSPEAREVALRSVGVRAGMAMRLAREPGATLPLIEATLAEVAPIAARLRSVPGVIVHRLKVALGIRTRKAATVGAVLASSPHAMRLAAIRSSRGFAADPFNVPDYDE